MRLFFLLTLLCFINESSAQTFSGHLKYDINFEEGTTYSVYTDAITGFVSLSKLEKKAIKKIDTWTSSINRKYKIIRIDKVKAGLGITPKVTITFMVLRPDGTEYDASAEKENRPKVSPNSIKLNNIILNQFDRSLAIERVFVVSNEGEDCNNELQDGQEIVILTESLLLGEYDILERRHFEHILDEQRLSASGVLFEETAVELGCNAGSQGIIFTEVGCLDGERTINLKLVGCQTSEIYWSCMGIGATPFETVKKIKEELSN